MKITSFEISKKLAETGFLDRLNRVGFWIARKNQDPFFVKESEMSAINFMNEIGDIFAAYDLETLIDVLPNFIANGNGTENCLVIDVAFGEIHYEGDSENDALFITATSKNESLADCAARLLIKLHEQGLIKFGE